MIRFAVALLLTANPEPAVSLPDGAVRVSENRYKLRQDWEGALKFFKSSLPPSSYPRKPIANQPGIKALHISNGSRGGWEGLNLYETNGEVRLFIVNAQAAVVESPSSPKPSRKRSF